MRYSASTNSRAGGLPGDNGRITGALALVQLSDGSWRSALRLDMPGSDTDRSSAPAFSELVRGSSEEVFDYHLLAIASLVIIIGGAKAPWTACFTD